MQDASSLWTAEELALLRKHGVDFFIRRAKQGIPKFQYLVGLMWYTGMHLEKDLAEAHRWFFSASSKGHPQAAYLLGSMWMKDEIPPSMGDPLEQGLLVFRLAARKGHPGAACAIGNVRTFHEQKRHERKVEQHPRWQFWRKKPMDVFLEDCPVSMEEALSCYALGEQKRYAPAFYFLGLHAANGWGVELSMDTALSFWKQGADLGDRDSVWMMALGMESRDGMNSETLSWYEKAAEMGVPAAQHVLGILHFDGIWLEKDFSIAKVWLHRAASQNHASAHAFLADLYGFHAPSEMEQDWKKAYEWATRAEMRGTMSRKEVNAIYRMLSPEAQKSMENIQERNREFDAIVEKMLGLPV